MGRGQCPVGVCSVPENRLENQNNAEKKSRTVVAAPGNMMTELVCLEAKDVIAK